MYEAWIAFVIVIASIIFLARVLKKVTDAKRQKVVVLIIAVIFFTAFMLFCLDTVNLWQPLNDFSVLAGVTDFWVSTFHVLVLLMYFIHGFSIGCGFLQVTQSTMDHVKESDMSIGSKSGTGKILRFIEYYFMTVVAALAARALLDCLGAIYPEPEVLATIDAITIIPFLWLFLGMIIATIKFWRDRKFNFDFSLKRVQKFMAADKVYIHRMLLVFWFLMGTWIMILLEAFAPAYPGLTIFSFAMLLGFMINKEPLGFA